MLSPESQPWRPDVIKDVTPDFLDNKLLMFCRLQIEKVLHEATLLKDCELTEQYINDRWCPGVSLALDPDSLRESESVGIYAYRDGEYKLYRVIHQVEHPGSLIMARQRMVRNYDMCLARDETFLESVDQSRSGYRAYVEGLDEGVSVIIPDGGKLNLQQESVIMESEADIQAIGNFHLVELGILMDRTHGQVLRNLTNLG